MCHPQSFVSSGMTSQNLVLSSCFRYRRAAARIALIIPEFPSITGLKYEGSSRRKIQKSCQNRFIFYFILLPHQKKKSPLNSTLSSIDQWKIIILSNKRGIINQPHKNLHAMKFFLPNPSTATSMSTVEKIAVVVAGLLLCHAATDTVAFVAPSPRPANE